MTELDVLKMRVENSLKIFRNIIEPHDDGSIQLGLFKTTEEGGKLLIAFDYEAFFRDVEMLLQISKSVPAEMIGSIHTH